MDGNRAHPGRLSSAPQTVFEDRRLGALHGLSVCALARMGTVEIPRPSATVHDCPPSCCHLGSHRHRWGLFNPKVQGSASMREQQQWWFSLSVRIRWPFLETLRGLAPNGLPPPSDPNLDGSCPATVQPIALSAEWQRRPPTPRAHPTHLKGASLDSDGPGPRPARQSTSGELPSRS